MTDAFLAEITTEIEFCESVFEQVTTNQLAEIFDSMRDSSDGQQFRRLVDSEDPLTLVAFPILARAGFPMDAAIEIARNTARFLSESPPSDDPTARPPDTSTPDAHT